MKIMQIMGGFCHWDASNAVRDLDECRRRFAPDMVFVEAPDHVREGWGYNPDAEGDARFIRPEAPEGWLYDDDTGTFYPEGEYPPGHEPDIWDELAAAYAEGVNAT